MELKPCPFCGGDEISHGRVDYRALSFGSVECHSCDAVVTADTEDDAVVLWNTRTETAEIAKLREDLAEAVAFVGDIAAQWLPDEPEPFDDFDPDFADAYKIIVTKARQTLAKIKGD